MWCVQARYNKNFLVQVNILLKNSTEGGFPQLSYAAVENPCMLTQTTVNPRKEEPKDLRAYKLPF